MAASKTSVIGLNSVKLDKDTIIASYTLFADGVYCDYDPVKKKADIGSNFLERESSMIACSRPLSVTAGRSDRQHDRCQVELAPTPAALAAQGPDASRLDSLRGSGPDLRSRQQLPPRRSISGVQSFPRTSRSVSAITPKNDTNSSRGVP